MKLPTATYPLTLLGLVVEMHPDYGGAPEGLPNDPNTASNGPSRTDDIDSAGNFYQLSAPEHPNSSCIQSGPTSGTLSKR